MRRAETEILAEKDVDNLGLVWMRRVAGGNSLKDSLQLHYPSIGLPARDASLVSHRLELVNHANNGHFKPDWHACERLDTLPDRAEDDEKKLTIITLLGDSKTSQVWQ